jgi:hypothetical protein
VLVLVVVLDCFPYQQTEDDDDHEDDQELASFRLSTIRLFVLVLVVVDCFPHRQAEDDWTTTTTRTIRNGGARVFPSSCSFSLSSSIAFPINRPRTTTTTRTIRSPLFPPFVLVVVVVLDCFPHQQAEGDDDHEDDQGHDHDGEHENKHD